MKFEDWLKTVPHEITDDSAWQTNLYRQALFLGDLTWIDIKKLVRTRHTSSLADQLYRSVGSISANFIEGYSHRSKRDQARFYEYSLGSAREARDWYFKARHILGEKVSTHRMQLCVHIIRQLLEIIPDIRQRQVGELVELYNTEQAHLFDLIPFSED